jgi:tRNA pseudouridine55 synthase
VFALALTALALPDARFRATVSGGTYLRGLARDVGEALGCGAHLAALTRTAVGPFALAQAVAPEAVTAAHLRPAAVLVGDLRRCELDAEQRAAVVHGRALPNAGAGSGERGAGNEEGWVALFHAGELIAVAAVVEGMLKPRVVMVDG